MRKFYFFFLIVIFSGNFLTAQTESVYQVALEEMNKKNYSLAIEYFTKTLELLTNNSDVYYNRGLCYSELKEYKKAIAEFKNAIKLKKLIPEYY